VNKDLVMNFTDDYNKVPLPYRDKIEREVVTSTLTQEVIYPKREEKERDSWGLDETYWRERVRPWKERLNEATANYENISNQFIEKTRELIQVRLGGDAQLEYMAYDLDLLNEQMKKYQADMTEADGMLRKVSKEAAETRANPDWLR